MSKRRGSVTAHLPPEPAQPEVPDMLEMAATLPPPLVLQAGVGKFLELAKIGWPGKDDAFLAFDYTNAYHLSIVLGLTYNEMRKLDRDKP
jgi:hypothetical protein